MEPNILPPNSWRFIYVVFFLPSLWCLLPHSSQKPNMKILVALAVFFLVSTQLFAEEIGANDDLNYWSDWSDSDQIKVRLHTGSARGALPGLRSRDHSTGRAPEVAWRAPSPRPETVEARGGV